MIVRRKPIAGALTAIAIALASSACSSHGQAPGTQPELKLERVVFVMRHGIRPPTKDPALPVNYADQAWPKWPVDYGLLTLRGAEGAKLLGAGDRAYYQAQGLLPASGCPADGTIAAQASAKERTIKTGEAYLSTFAPGCAVALAHPADESADAMFHPLDSAPESFDGHRAYQEALALAPPGGMTAEATNDAAAVELLNKALGCCGPQVCAKKDLKAGCGLADMPTALVENKHDRPELDGPLSLGSTISQTFLLEYLEGMPMKQVAWGRLTRDQIETLLRFHPIKFRYENGAPYVARAAAGPLVQVMLKALTAPEGGPRFTMLFGHDTNIADVGSLLGLDWQVKSYPKDDIPPGGALGFELYRDGGGHQFVRAFFRAQTMDQLRNLVPLTGSAQPYRAYLTIPGCDQKEADSPCPLDRFTAIVQQKLSEHS